MSLFDLFREHKQINALRQEVDELRRKVNALDEEWSDYYDRFRRLMAKMSKRDERAAASEVREDAPQEGVGDGTLLTLTPTQRKIQAAILARRARASSGGE